MASTTLTSPGVQTQPDTFASQTLGGPPALAEELAALKTLSTSIAQSLRIEALKRIGDLAPESESALPNLVRGLKAGDSETRIAAAEAIGKFGERADIAVPALVDALKSGPRYAEPGAMITALSRLGTAGIKALLENVELTGSYFGYAVAEIARSGHPAAKLSVPLLLNTLDSESSTSDQVRGAANALSLMQEPLGMAPLAKLLKHPNALLRCTGARSLTAYGAEVPKETIEKLFELATKDGEMKAVRTDALQTLSVIGEPRERVADVVEIFTKAESFRLRETAYRACEKLPPVLAVPLLERGLKDEDGDVVLAAAETLTKHGAAGIAVLEKYAGPKERVGHSVIDDVLWEARQTA